MLDLEPIFEFSRQNCVTICSFLVPANLIATISTFAFVVTNRSWLKIGWSSTLALIFATALFLHVSTWFMIGVVTPVTFILFGLGATCLLANALVIVYRQNIVQTLSSVLSRG